MKIIHTFIFAIILYFSFSSCSSQRESTQRIRIAFRMPLQVVDGIGYGDSVNIYVSYKSNYRIVELPHHETLESNNTFIYDSIKYEFICFNEKKKVGYILKNSSEAFHNKINVDSLLQKRAFNLGDGKQINPDSMNVIGSSQTYSDNRYRIDKFIFQSGGIYDSVYFYFDREMNAIPFSWSKKLDDKYGLKFCKLVLFVKHDPLNINSSLNEFYKTSYEIKKDTAKNEEEIKKLFNRFIEFDKKQVE